MKIQVRVYSRSKRNLVDVVDDTHVVVRVSVVPEAGKANDRVIELLAEHFDVAKSCVRIVAGASSRDKTIEILGK